MAAGIFSRIDAVTLAMHVLVFFFFPVSSREFVEMQDAAAGWNYFPTEILEVEFLQDVFRGGVSFLDVG